LPKISAQPDSGIDPKSQFSYYLVSRSKHFTDINWIVVFWDVRGKIFFLDLLGCIQCHKPGSWELAGRGARSSSHGSNKWLW
jgi:hypothetical protein